MVDEVQARRAVGDAEVGAAMSRLEFWFWIAGVGVNVWVWFLAFLWRLEQIYGGK